MSARELSHAADANQARAADPDASAWVSANAGTGKTQVLVKRILRLLLASSGPECILCLTYTKTAAAEMQTSVVMSGLLITLAPLYAPAHTLFPGDPYCGMRPCCLYIEVIRS